jgi:hypothetical protein
MEIRICKYYQKGYCTKGDSCDFAHTNMSRVCKFFQNGGCNKEEKCKFAHMSIQNLIRRIARYPEWEPPERNSPVLTMEFKGGFKDRYSRDRHTRFGWEVTLHGINIDNEIFLLKEPIIHSDEDLNNCLMRLLEYVENMNIKDSDNFLQD